jgi:hypothetical protein
MGRRSRVGGERGGEEQVTIAGRKTSGGPERKKGRVAQSPYQGVLWSLF